MRLDLFVPMVALLVLGVACSDETTNPLGPPPTGAGGSGGAGGAGGAPGGAGGGIDVAAVKARLETTLGELADLGTKRCGTPGGVAAGDHVSERFEALGISDVTFEPFSFLAHDVASSSLAVTVDGAPVAMAHDVFAYSGAGQVDADIVDVGKGKPEDYAGKDVTGKVVLVERDPVFHRSAQYIEVVAHGGAAMLYVSTSPTNLIQIGTVADPEDGLGPVPTVTVGQDDGKKIKDALAASMAAHAVIDVLASVSPAQGRNVVARVPGTDPSGAYVMVGAHYDTWYVGSTDNGTGVASLLELAEQVVQGGPRRLGVVFVAYDGEELGLFGGYDWLRKHVIVGAEPMLAFVNLEMPGAGPKGTGLRALAHTHEGPIDPAAKEVNLHKLYITYVGMEVVPAQFGGLIPTDIQGMYWHGLQGMTTYCATDYYHTPEDTPDKVDTAFLADATVGLLAMLDGLDDEPLASFAQLDDQLWNPTVATKTVGAGDLEVTVTALDAAGTIQPAAAVRVWVDVDDFTRAFDASVVADEYAVAKVVIPAADLAEGSGSRWLHVTAGKTFPLSERIQPIP